MAKALECPACGAKHRLDGLDPAETFRCDRCGQKLKIPASVGSAAAAAEADGDGDGATASTTATTTTGTVAPPPRRRASAAGTTAVIGASTTLSRGEGDGAEDGDGQPPDEKSRKAKRAATPRRRVKWYWRIIAWIVAVPLGFALTAWPAYEFGLIRKDDVLDVFIGSGTDRYTRLAVVTLLWALVTAVLVQVFIEGGRIWADRRRHRRESTGGVAPPHGARATG